MTGYNIERDPRWDRADKNAPAKKFFVYVLSTKYGHYVGHTGNLDLRLNDHMSGKVQSTYGGRPKLIWKSKPLPSRDAAAAMERALKVLRDGRDSEYSKLVGVKPFPWRGAWKTAETRRLRRR